MTIVSAEADVNDATQVCSFLVMLSTTKIS